MLLPVLIAFPRLDVQPVLSTHFDQNNTEFYLICDWPPLTNTDSAFSIYGQFYKNGLLYEKHEIQQNATSIQLQLSSDIPLGHGYGDEVSGIYRTI